MQRSRPGAVTALPSTRISPRSGRMRPAITRIRVVLPQPEGPSRQTNSLLRTENETLCSATRPGLRGSFCSKKTLLSWLTSSINIVTRARCACSSEHESRSGGSLLLAELLHGAIDEAPVEKLVVRHRIFEEPHFLQKIDGEVVRALREVAVDAPDARIDEIVGLRQGLGGLVGQNLFRHLHRPRFIRGDPAVRLDDRLGHPLHGIGVFLD